MKAIMISIFIIVSISLTGSLDAKAVEKKTAQTSVEFMNSKEHLAKNFPFSEIVRVGNLLFLSGKIGLNPQTRKLVPGGIRAETKQTMDNIRSTLTKHGYSMKNIVKCTVMLADISQWQTFNEVYVTYFTSPYPARSAFGANGLALNSSVEVECIAAVGDVQAH